MKSECDFWGCAQEAVRYFRINSGVLSLCAACEDCAGLMKALPITTAVDELSMDEFIVEEIMNETPRRAPAALKPSPLIVKGL